MRSQTGLGQNKDEHLLLPQGLQDLRLPIGTGRDLDESNNVKLREPSLTLSLGVPVGKFARFRTALEVAHQSWRAADDTDPNFLLPSDGFVGSLRLSGEFHRKRWDARAWLERSRRLDWEPWGPDALDGTEKPFVTSDDYWKWGARQVPRIS